MSVENVKKFFEDVAKDETLKKKVQELQSEISDREISKTGSPEEAINMIISIAEKLGYNFSEDELKDYVSKLELSDDMLATVSGGAYLPGIPLGEKILLGIITLGLLPLADAISDAIIDARPKR